MQTIECTKFKNILWKNALPYDHLVDFLPCLSNCAFIYPPLAIEGDTIGSTIGSESAIPRWGYAIEKKLIDTSMYYGNPNWFALYTNK